MVTLYWGEALVRNCHDQTGGGKKLRDDDTGKRVIWGEKRHFNDLSSGLIVHMLELLGHHAGPLDGLLGCLLHLDLSTRHSDLIER